MPADDSRPERYKINDDGWELIDCHIQAARNWDRVVRGLLTLRQLRAFWGVLGHYLKEVKQRGLAVDA